MYIIAPYNRGGYLVGGDSYYMTPIMASSPRLYVCCCRVVNRQQKLAASCTSTTTHTPAHLHTPAQSAHFFVRNLIADHLISEDRAAHALHVSSPSPPAGPPRSLGPQLSQSAQGIPLAVFLGAPSSPVFEPLLGEQRGIAETHAVPLHATLRARVRPRGEGEGSCTARPRGGVGT